MSIDPIYRFTHRQIRERIAETYETVMAQTRENRDKFVWNTIRSVEELGRVRMAAMQRFLDDYEKGLQQGRYIAAELPQLPFGDLRFYRSYPLRVAAQFSAGLSQSIAAE